jgi:D-alanyl-D-alanine carboxypeptidase
VIRPRSTSRVNFRATTVFAAMAAVLLLLGLAPPARAAATVARPAISQAELQALLDQIVAAGAPGAIGLVRDGGQTVRAASGVASLGSGRRMHTGERYRVGSITKTFVATVVLQLAGEGRLRLSDPVERWLPGLVPNGRRITIRQLLNHTSGLFNYTEDPRVLAPYLHGDRDFVWWPRQLVAVATSHPPVFAPGTSWSYSNTNYILLGLIVRAVTGRALKDQLEQRIFQPLHLRGTSFPVTEAWLPDPHPHGYAYLGGEAPTPTDTTRFSASWAGAAGAIVSTVDDVARFYTALLGGHLLRPAQLADMKTMVDAVPPPARYGLGLFALPAGCATAWGHNGDFVGYYNFAVATENASRQVVLMINLDDSGDAGVWVPPGLDDAFTGALVTAFCAGYGQPG